MKKSKLDQFKERNKKRNAHLLCLVWEPSRTLNKNGWRRLVVNRVYEVRNHVIFSHVVVHLTEKLRKEITHGFITGLAGKEGAWHIDHRYSILKGYQNKVSPFVIGNRSNLEMVPWKDNLSKHSSCSISLGGLLQSCGYTEDQSLNEFNKFVFLINNDIRDGIPPNGAFLIERYYATNLRT